jgi:hypothetical protein
MSKLMIASLAPAFDLRQFGSILLPRMGSSLFSRCFLLHNIYAPVVIAKNLPFYRRVVADFRVYSH